MKKTLLFIFTFFIFNNTVFANKIEVKLDKCVDGDTAWFILDNETIKTRFLAIDTPESTNEIEEYGIEASEYTCNLLSTAKKIEIEYDSNSDKLDKYDRHLVWVFVDNILLQEKILEKGYASIEYIYGDYKYLDYLYKIEKEAKDNNIGIWNNEVNTNYTFLIIGLIIITLICLISKKGRKKIYKLIKKEMKA